MNPIEEQKTIGQRFRSSRFMTDWLFAFKVAVGGLVIFIVGDVLESETFMQLGIWTLVAALPIHAVAEGSRFLLAVKDADDEVNQVVSDTKPDNT